MSNYANPKKALAICDVCGDRWYRSQLKYQVIAGQVQKILACPECWDIDNQQLLLSKLHGLDDPTSVYDPRPDLGYPVERGGYAWDPVGGIGLVIVVNPMTTEITYYVDPPIPVVDNILLTEGGNFLVQEGNGYILLEEGNA